MWVWGLVDAAAASSHELTLWAFDAQRRVGVNLTVVQRVQAQAGWRAQGMYVADSVNYQPRLSATR